VFIFRVPNCSVSNFRYHQEPQVQDEHLYEELKRLRKENARLKEEREILKKAAAYFAQQLP
jgi:transposase-like protein